MLLTSILGDDDRTTKDMDATIRGIPLTIEDIKTVFNEILSININDGVTFEIISIKDIRLEDEYGGYRLNILSKLDINKTYITVELTTGDIITPREIKYSYNCIFEDKKIVIMAYTIETVIAEKFHSIIERGIINTRMKDFYDMYVLMNKNVIDIEKKTLVKAIKNTFLKRDTMFDINEFKIILEDLIDDDNMKKLWLEYQKKNNYATEIEYDETINAVKMIINVLENF